jgi:diphthamide biosynthesis protein 7
MVESREPLAPSIAYVDTEYSADCIEFCPFEGYQDIFICGTYQVLEPKTTDSNGNHDNEDDDTSTTPPKPTERTGRLLVCRVGDDEASL